MTIDRRGLIMTGAAGLLLATPGRALAALTPQNTVSWSGKTFAEHRATTNQYAAKGLRSISLSIYDAPFSPMFCGIMTLRPVVLATEEYDALTEKQFQLTFNAMAAKGWGPYILSATGPVGLQIYAVVFAQMAQIPLTRANLTSDQFAAQNDAAHAVGLSLWSFDTFGDPSDPHFCAIWGPNPKRRAWACIGPSDDPATDQQRFNAQTSAWSRPQEVSMIAPGQSVVSYTEAAIGPFTSHVDMSSAQFQSTFNSEVAKGRMPYRVSGCGSGPDARFAAIFTTREEFDPIQPVSSQGPVKDNGIDTAVANFMVAENIQGMSVAVCLGAKLVYARGYTNADVHYPPVTPTTSFRQASISKFFIAAAWWRLFQTRTDVTLQTKVQDILRLTPPPTLSNGDYFNLQPTFLQITLQNLLESCSGLDQSQFLNAPSVAAQYGGKPVGGNSRELASWIACQPNPGTPGDHHNVVYGNVDYMLLGLALATLFATGGDVEAAVRQVLLAPLGVGDSTRASRTMIGDQPTGEARYHLRTYDHNPNDNQLDPLSVSPSQISEPQVLAPDQYGAWVYETFVGAGGLSASAVDVARLAACLSCRTANPVFTTDTIDAWMTLAAIATKTYQTADPTNPNDPAHGFHGLDWLDVLDSANKTYNGVKGGWLPSHQSIVNFVTGGYTVVTLWNGNTVPDSPAPALGVNDYLGAINNAIVAPGANLSSADLFPTPFGMASFPTTLEAVKIAPKIAPIDLKGMQARLQRSWSRARAASSREIRPQHKP